MRPVAEKETKILRPALLRGREWCVHHLPKSKHLHPWVVRLRAACFDACRLVWRGPGRAGRLPCGRLHGAAWLEAAARERGRRRVEAVLEHNCIATDCSTGGTSVYPRAAPPSRVAREDEPLERFLAVKGAVHVPVSSSCTFEAKS